MDRPRLLFESVLIVASVALGFAVTEWRQRVSDRDLARTVLENVAQEVRQNRETVRQQIARHEQMLAALSSAPPPAAGQSAWDYIRATLKESIGALPMRQAAWDAAVSSGALRVIDYGTAARLSDIYSIQNVGYGGALERIGESLYVPENFRAADAPAMIARMRYLLDELRGLETFLLETYDRHLAGLGASGQTPRS